MNSSSASLLERLFTEHEALRAYLIEKQELSYVSTVEETMPKVLLLAAASLFEHNVVTCVLDFYREVVGTSQHAAAFVEAQALSRQYHTLFEWKNRSGVNKFFGLFGPDFRNYARDIIRSDQHLLAGAEAFIELGNLRNTLVHENYAAFVMPKTAEEVFELAEKAAYFVGWLPEALKQFPPPSVLPPV